MIEINGNPIKLEPPSEIETLFILAKKYNPAVGIYRDAINHFQYKINKVEPDKETIDGFIKVDGKYSYPSKVPFANKKRWQLVWYIPKVCEMKYALEFNGKEYIKFNVATGEVYE